LFLNGIKDDNRRITITEQYGDAEILLHKEINVEELRDFPGSVLILVCYSDRSLFKGEHFSNKSSHGLDK